MSKKNLATVAAAATIVGMGVANSETVYPTDESMRKNGMMTLSARIRHLSGLGASTSQIAKIVKRENGAHPLYQHVRNVLNTPLKGNGDVVASTPTTAAEEA